MPTSYEYEPADYVDHDLNKYMHYVMSGHLLHDGSWKMVVHCIVALNAGKNRVPWLGRVEQIVDNGEGIKVRYLEKPNQPELAVKDHYFFRYHTHNIDYL